MLRLVLLATLLAHVYGQLHGLCVYTNWAQYRVGVGRFIPEDIDPSLCTNILYSFADMEGNNLVPIEWNDETMYQGVIAHKDTHPDLRVSLSVGGWNFELEKMTAMMSSPANREEFISSSIEFLRSRGFDGLHLAFLYPGSFESPPDDKFRYTELVQELQQGFEDEAEATGQEKLLLSASVGATETLIDNGYEVPEVSEAVDFLSLMTYDLNGAWNNYTGHNSPLFPREEEDEDQRKLNIEYVSDYWVSQGADPAKLIIGMTTYGRGFTLEDPTDDGFGAPVEGASDPGEFTNEPGLLSYYEICVLGDEPGAVRYWHEEHAVPWLVSNDQWMGYDSQESLIGKVAWLKTQGYGGYMIWAMDLDDFTGGFCGEDTYPLLTALHSELERS